MEGETPRTLIRGVLQTSQGTRSSPRRRETPSSTSIRESTDTLTTLQSRESREIQESLRSYRSVSLSSHHQPISSGKVSSSVKRPARGSSTSKAKRRRSVTSTPSETITPRTNIRVYLAAADTKTPAEPSETRTAHQRLSRSAISNRQVQKLIASESPSRRASPRKSLSQSFPTPRESITPREAMKLYLNAADTVPRARRSTPKWSNIRNAEADQDESSEEKAEDSESAAADDERSQDEEIKPESGEESGEYGDEPGESVEERAELSELDERAESGDEKSEINDEKGESQEDVQNDRLEHRTEFPPSPQPKNRYESSHEATGDSSQDEQAGGPRREQDSSQEATSSQGEQQMENATNQSRMQGSLQGGESLHETVTEIRNKSGHSRSAVKWGKLRTPVLPDTTTVKATPVVLRKPAIPVQQKKTSNIKKASGKESQTKKPKRKGTSVPRLPSTLVNGIFRHFSALRVSKDALDAVQVGSDAFFEHITTDLTSYCNHARRKTIEESDAVLLMRRQGLVKSKESFHALIEKYLPMEYRQEIIPTAKSGNKVVPKEKT